MKPPLFGKTFQEISQIVKDLSLPSFTVKQISDWLYKKKISSLDDLTNLSLKSRELLKEHYTLGLKAPVAEQISKDGTKKFLFPVLEDKYVEAAFIPDRDRATLCISSQVGCRMGCSFCMTARQPMRGNLNATDILNQFQSLPDHDVLTNIVYMGMGEPFDNLAEVMKSLDILTADYGYAWASKRITVSTIGILPSVRHFMDNSRCHLAVSLHHPDPAERRKLMPVENKYPIKQIIDLLKTYDLNRQRRISFEYIMLSGINDSNQQIKEMVKLLSGLKCRVNLIPFHPIPGSPFIPSATSVIRQFAETLNEKGIVTTVRQSRGMDIDAACGMLSTARNQ
ncbi:MAG: 23S rRNA (adenine(2503)-C(2))-methyltransferase RlmN [Bacteroidales bacterium]|jgi:23S rRNA (adenine2503-C2)-methyltransferase|nr:23S rRNA (adenine(2503)-C(2))-methyltransferase RlmN [Bacteroidales bacterium]